MCGLLSQGATGSQVQPLYGDFNVPYDCSHLFIAIDVAHFCDAGWFRQQTAAAAERIRSGRRARGVEQLFTPGEPEWRRRQGAGGKIHMQPSVVAMLTRLASDLGLTSTPFQTTAKETRHA
jgi:LDH2 family malate/lactate/ureidoglycolate dehydrogenase